MESGQQGKPSARSLRIRWTDDANRERSERARQLLELATGRPSVVDEDVPNVASHNGEFYMTLTFADESAAKEAYARVAKHTNHAEHFDHVFDGLTILHSPTESDIDICSIHGLNGNAVDTFTGQSKLWLRDLLPHTRLFTNARIMAFGYNSRLTDRHEIARMDDWADTLLRAVGSIRTDASSAQRPIIFVAHSMGGLVVRRAMERLQQFAELPERYPGILLINCGILFLSTPHLGTTTADYSNIYSETLSLLTGLRKDAILNELKSFNDSAGDSIDRWSIMRRNGTRPPFQCLCESRETKIKFNIYRQVVSPVAAGFLDQSAVQLPNADHHQVCKYDTSFSQGYKDVIGKLVHLRAKLITPNMPSPRQSLQLPGEPPLSPYRSPLPKDRKWYIGSLLKKRTGKFRGREEALVTLQHDVNTDLASGEGNVIALAGIGGTGKTELLVEYGFRAQRMKHVFSCQALAGQTFQSCLYALANAVGSEALPSNINLADKELLWNRYNEAQRVDAFTQWLARDLTDPSVVLVDDVDALQNKSDLEGLSTVLRTWPYTVLLTTRDPNLGKELADASYRDSVAHTIGKMSENELVQIMQHHVAAGFDLTQDELTSIARAVHGHVMAACHAVEFICHVLATTCDGNAVQLFLRSLQPDSDEYAIRKSFLNFQPRLGRSLSTCFETSIERLGALQPRASLLLNFVAYMAAPELDFRRFFQHPRPWIDRIPPEETIITRELFEISRAEFAEAVSSMVATAALIRTEERTLMVPSLMAEYLLQRQGDAGRKHILKQIILLSTVSMCLNESTRRFKRFIDNCTRIASRFRVDLADVTPTSSTLSMITGSG